ncbi:hypothetical protein OIU78_025489 [Salix suchowensis]|nr:hypothetical protein OIU78_025489 [Salix suchowensis]
MGNNSLTGQIPPELGKCQSLIWLDLNSNNLTGPLPPELADQAGLVVPGTVSGKQFAFVRNEGGTSCRGAGGLVEFHVYTFTTNGSMIFLDLAYNSLSGDIPQKFGSMSYLQVLNLGHNKLTGNIPDSFGGLKAIGVLDLSHNDLQGFLPGSLGSLSFLSDLDVSNNNLTALEATPESYNTRRKKQSVEVGMVIGITFFILCVFGLAMAFYRVKKYQQKEEQREKYIESLPTSGSSSWKLSGVPEPLSINIATFEKPLRKLTFAHLLEATNGFSADSLIGSGGFGEVYKAQLGDGCVVAIKKLIHVTGQGDREFMAEMETIGKIKHRNLLYREKRCNEILDPELMTQTSGESKLYQYLRIAFECLDDRPFRRPTMIQVMAMFKELQVDSESDILDGLSLKDASIDEFKEESSS